MGASTRIALRIIQTVAVVVGILAAAAGATYFIIAAAGPEVWWPSGGSNASGAFVAFPLELGLLAYVIGAGERLQRDTEGLV